MCCRLTQKILLLGVHLSKECERFVISSWYALHQTYFICYFSCAAFCWCSNDTTYHLPYIFKWWTLWYLFWTKSASAKWTQSRSMQVVWSLGFSCCKIAPGWHAMKCSATVSRTSSTFFWAVKVVRRITRGILMSQEIVQYIIIPGIITAYLCNTMTVGILHKWFWWISVSIRKQNTSLNTISRLQQLLSSTSLH